MPYHDIDPRAAVDHLTSGHWDRANRLLVRKALAEFAHERILTPRSVGNGRYSVHGHDGSTEYRFSAEVMALDHWHIDAASIVRTRSGTELPPDALDFVLELRDTLGVDDELLPVYLEEITSTLSSRAYHLAAGQMSATELAVADFQTIETSMAEGHPCFVANNARLGFDSTEYHRYAPEAACPVRLLWVATRRELTTLSLSAGMDYERLVGVELDDGTRARFAEAMRLRGLDLDDYYLVPTHPWQWRNKLSVTFAADIARGNIVCLGPGDDEYLAQQSVRTFFNVSTPSRCYVKTALSVLNMGFVRGLSAGYMQATPAINDWVADVIAGDEVLRTSRFGILRELAAVGYHSRHYEAAAPAGSAYLKMFAALWRESPVPDLADGERLATMASLLHVGGDGRHVVSALIERSGLGPAAWLRAYLDAYLRPLLHCFYAYGLVFMPHGENVIMVLSGDVPRRVLIKDIAEEIGVLDKDVPVPPPAERVRLDVPEDLWTLSIFTDIFDCFLRFLQAALHADGTASADTLWSAVASCVLDYQTSTPHLADRFEKFDLFADEFDLSCLNRLQLRNNKQMVDLQEPVDSLALVGTLTNPIAPYAPRRER